jgi:hypothetical protein
MSQKNTMSKLLNGSRVISYEFGSYPFRFCPLHFLLSGRRYSQGQAAAINASSSIAFDNVDYHQTITGNQA